MAVHLPVSLQGTEGAALRGAAGSGAGHGIAGVAASPHS